MKKQQVGRILSEWLRDIGQEQTEIDERSDKGKLITKFEQLARIMWRKALTGNKEFVAMVIDRIEGRVTTAEQQKTDYNSLPKKVSEGNLQRMNKIARSTETEI